MKKCRKCGETKPKTEEYFYPVRTRGFFDSYCLPCRKEARKKRHQERMKDPAFVEQKRQIAWRRRRDPKYKTANIWIDSRAQDKAKGRKNDLTKPFIEAAISEGCTYCGSNDRMLMTLDRIDNALGHLTSNVLPACERCNIVRRDMPFEAWLLVVPGMRAAQESGLLGDWQPGPQRRKRKGQRVGAAGLEPATSD